MATLSGAPLGSRTAPSHAPLKPLQDSGHKFAILLATNMSSATTSFTSSSTATMTVRNRRRASTHDAHCQPHSLDALDLSTASAKRTLASLRILVLSYLADVENRLAHMETSLSESRLAETLKLHSGVTIEDIRGRTMEALDMLQGIRRDVYSHLPEFPDFHLGDISVENIMLHLPELPDVPSLEQIRSHVPTLFPRLHSLRQHLQSFDLPSIGFSLPSNTALSDLLDSFLSSELVAELRDDVNEAEDMIQQATEEFTHAIERSLNGSKLIQYVDLPDLWKNNSFVTGGYRFIPLERWPLILLSMFTIHNESLNIYTHLIPFVLWLIHLMPRFTSSNIDDKIEVAFISFALVCLFSSVIWHTMSGCAHAVSMEICARIDYVGIGWLISASVGTVVHYGLQCHPSMAKFYLLCCLMVGITGNIFPFMKWFNDRHYRGWRVLFYVCMAFTAIAPLASLSHLHSFEEMLRFSSPVWPSVLSYLIGLVFYATHIPERFFPEKYSHWLDWCGGGSHAIWHAFIVLAISQHRAAIALMREGIECSVPP